MGQWPRPTANTPAQYLRAIGTQARFLRLRLGQIPYLSLDPWVTQVAPGTLGIGVSKNSTSSISSGAPLGRLDRTLDAHQLGELYLCRPASTIFKDLTRAPHRLPPSIQIPGRRGRVWLESEVVRWLKEFQELRHDRPDVEPSEASRLHAIRPTLKQQDTNARRVGRPTKREQLERAKQLAARGRE
jgi:hypothetical protein